MFVCLELWQKHQYILTKTYLSVPRRMADFVRPYEKVGHQMYRLRGWWLYNTYKLFLFQTIYNWINTTRKTKFQNDKCTIILMNLILLHNTDGLQLNDSALVEKAQQNFINFLHKYLKSHLPETTAYSQLHKALMLVHDTQRIHELSLQRLKL